MEQDLQILYLCMVELLLCIQKDYKNAFDVDELDAYLKEDHDFKICNSLFIVILQVEC